MNKIQLEKTLCKIKINQELYIHGFFTIIHYPTIFESMLCLITNNKIINSQFLTNAENIEIILNKKTFNISFDYYRRIWTDEKLDFTCIEIIRKDKIYKKIKPLEIINTISIRDTSSDNNNNYDKRYFIYFNNSEEIELIQSKLNKIDDSSYNQEYKDVIPGTPLFLNNEMDNLIIIGINSNKDEKGNLKGIYIINIINYIKNNKANNFLNKNIIRCVLTVPEEKVGRKLTVFQQSDENKDQIGSTIVYLNNKKIKLLFNKRKSWFTNDKFTKSGLYNITILLDKSITNLSHFFAKCYYLSIDLKDFDSSKITKMDYLFGGCEQLKKIEGLNNLDTSNVVTMESMFLDCKELTYLNLYNFNTSKVTNFNAMFGFCNKLENIYGLENFDTRNITKMESIFNSCNSLKYLDLSNFDMSNVTSLDYLFKECFKLKQIKGLKKFNTSKVINMTGVFLNCKKLKFLDLSNFDTSNVETMKEMFSSCTKLNEIKGFENLNTKNVKNMCSLFSNCISLEKIDLNNLNTSNCENLCELFNYCEKIKNFDFIKNLDTKNVTTMEAMFEGCKSAEIIDISNLDTSNVTNMQFLFNDCINLKEIKGLGKINTANVRNMNLMFQNCANITRLNLSNFDTSNVQDMCFMFNNCNNLKQIEGLNNFNTRNVTNMKAMFQLCPNLENLNLSNFDVRNVEDMEFMFYKCPKLKKLNLDKFQYLMKCKYKNMLTFTNKNCEIICKSKKIKSLLGKKYEE